jgi:peptidoglycan/LPS O-acetylase OafA/YrhL
MAGLHQDGKHLGYVPALDGLRAVSIALVVSLHAFGFPGGGSVGVDVFFVLSGFLITTLLLEERAAGGIGLRAFYMRRVRRLLPALAVMLAVYLAVTAAAGQDQLRAAAIGVSYVANIVNATGSQVLQDAHLNHLWSLAQEEQFYLVWPFALIALARTRWLLGVIVGAFLGVTIYRALLATGSAPGAHLYYGPDTRADGLLIGAAIAVVRFRMPLRIGEWGGQLGLVGLGLGAIAGWRFNGWAVWGEPVFLVTVSLLLVAALSDTALARGLTKRPCVWLGKRSYSLYVWHSPVIAAAFYLGGHTTLMEVTGAVAAVSAAAVSYRFVETPLRARRGTAHLPAPANAIVASP